MRYWLATLALLALGNAPAHTDVDLSWLAGRWISLDTPNDTTNLRWEVRPDGSLRGAGRTWSGGQRPDLLQEMEIRAGERGAVLRVAMGDSRAQFREVTHGPAGIVFENRRRGWPQRISYLRDGSDLVMEAAMADGSAKRFRRYGRYQPY